MSTADRRDKVSRLDGALRGMFRTLQSRPLPGTLRSVVDQLDEGPQPPLKKSGQA